MAQIALPFADFLDPTGLQRLKAKLDQALANPADTVIIAFEHLTDEQQQQLIELAVTVTELAGQYIIEAAQLNQTPVPAWVQGIASKINALRIAINQTTNAIEEWLVEMESELESFREEVQDELAKIPYRIERDGTNYRVIQTAPIEGRIAETPLKITSSSVTFNASTISQFAFAAELSFTNLKQENDQPFIANVALAYSSNQLQLSGSSFPPAKIAGHKFTLQSINLILQNNQFMPGSNAQGELVFEMLDPGPQGPGTLTLEVNWENNGNVIYEAQNPEGKEFKKNAISLFFSQVRIEDRVAASPVVDMQGWFQLAGVKDPNTGLPLKTDFTLSYLEPHFSFTGVNFAPSPIGFGTVTFATVLLKLHEDGTVVQNNFTGQWLLPAFDSAPLDFNISYLLDQDKTLNIIATNPQSTPLQMGQLSLTLGALQLQYRNNLLETASGNGELVLPHFTEGDPILVNVRFTRVNQNETLFIEATNINGKSLAGADVDLQLVQFTYLNGDLDATTINGLLQLPDTTDGAKLAVVLNLSNGGDDCTLTLTGDAADKELNFGPVALTFNNFLAESVAGNLQTLSGDGLLQLPGFAQAFAFSFTADPSQTPVAYTITVANVETTLFNIALSDVNMTLISTQSQPFDYSANGNLRLPLFVDGAALGFSLNVQRNQTYTLTANSAQANDLLVFGDFKLGNLNLSLTVDAGDLTLFNGSAQLTLPAFELPVGVTFGYSGALEEYTISLQNAFQTELAGTEINLSQFDLKITQGSFTSASALGNLKLPDATGGAGISFILTFLNNGRDADLNLIGNATEKTIEFGEVTLEFDAFSLSIRNGAVTQVSGSGALSLPGLSQPMPFSLSADFTDPQAPLYRVEVQNLGADFANFNLQFNQIEIVAQKGSLFTAAADGTLTLSALTGDPLNFNLLINRGNNYHIAINGSGQALNYGGLTISDLDLELIVQNGNVNLASGSAQLAIAGLSPAAQTTLVVVNYTSVPERFQLGLNQVFPLQLGPVDLQVNSFNFTLLNGAFEAGSLAGTATLPVLANGQLNFSLTLTTGGQNFTGTLNSQGNITGGSLTLRNVNLTVVYASGSLQSINGTAELQTALSDDFTSVNVSYSANKLMFSAQNPPPVILGGLAFNFNSIGFSLHNGQLTNGNLSGSVTLPGFDNGKNSFDFSYTLTQTNNHTFSVSYPAANPLHLKKGAVDLYLKTLTINTLGTTIQSASGALDFSIQGVNKRIQQDEAALISLSANYNSGADNFEFSLSNAPQLSLGGFDFTLNNLTLNLGSGGLNYPFNFEGELVIPGLQNESGHNASLAVRITVASDDTFSGTITTQPAPTFNFGAVKLTLNTLGVTKVGQRLEVSLQGLLELTTFSTMGGEEATMAVNVSIDNQGNFSILGEVANGGSVKVADVPAVVRLYLSKIGLSRANNNWDFTLGGLIENQIVLPGMEDLLPSEINLKDLSVGSDFGLDMDLRWPTGFSVTIGGAATEALIPVNGRFGETVSLEAIKLSFTPLPGNAGASLGLSLSGASLTLGPVAATVEGLGVEALITRAPVNAQGQPTGDANFGVVNVDFEFMPPQGLGVSLETPVFTGGGYLFFDSDKGEYAGALELSFMNLFAVSAIGLINNKMPDGQPGTSVLFIISVEFTPGIALGFGFFISGLGGILGVHRTMQVERLRDGVRDGSIKNILFPTNIIANISRIISDIKEIFPIQRHQFIVGPMAAITWGIPTILRIDLGLAIEIGKPTKFAILGVLRVLLPDEAIALIRLQVAFLGVLDLEKKMLSFDASLFDSKVLTFGLEGDMALRLGWGSKPDFVLSMGGFHPSYSPPTHLGIPNLKRLTLKILSGNPRLTLSSYFAVTSNTVQFGAGIDFYFGVAGFKVVGELGFDVLFQFSPFRFIADARARLAVKAGSATILSITLTFTLEGPAPWRAKGTAKFKILFISVKVRFDTTWGEKRETSLPDIAVLPLLEEALENNQNWRSLPGSNHIEGMRMRGNLEGDELILTPNGRIEISQKIVPLNTSISKFGQFKPADYTKFEITRAKVGSHNGELEPLYDDFAPANFLDVADSERLALPSFEEQEAGVKITAQGALKCGNVVDREVKYETSIMDEEAQQIEVMRLAEQTQFSALESTFFSLRGAVGQSKLSAARRNIVNPAKVKMKKPVYAVVDNDDFSVQGQAQGLNYMQAQEALSHTLSSAGAQIVTTELLEL